MPLYKYRCTECESTFKVLQKNGKKDELPECPECGSSEVERMISSVGIRFKGNGFYRTDYDAIQIIRTMAEKKVKMGTVKKPKVRAGKR